MDLETDTKDIIFLTRCLKNQNGTLYPIEIKKSASPGKSAIKNFDVLNPITEPQKFGELEQYKVANLSVKDREALFRNTARKCGMNEAIVEKDFWVCWAMDYLFQHSQWKEST